MIKGHFHGPKKTFLYGAFTEDELHHEGMSKTKTKSIEKTVTGASQDCGDAMVMATNFIILLLYIWIEILLHLTLIIIDKYF